jgi:hypothetical protein
MIFRRKKVPEISIPAVTSRVREFLLDSQIDDAHHMSAILGCPLISDELADKEEEESDNRVAQVDHLIPILYAYAQAMAQGIVEHQKEHLEEDEETSGVEIPDKAWAATRKVFAEISLNMSLGAISQLVDMGFLVVPNKKGKYGKRY